LPMRRFFFLLLLLPAMAFATSAPGNTDDRIVSSWQVDHPVATGMLSALALGVWPARFGSDAVEKSVTLASGRLFLLCQGLWRNDDLKIRVPDYRPYPPAILMQLHQPIVGQGMQGA